MKNEYQLRSQFRNVISIINQRNRQIDFWLSLIIMIIKPFFKKGTDVLINFKTANENLFKNVLAKVNKTIPLLRKRRKLSPRTEIINIYKAFI